MDVSRPPLSNEVSSLVFHDLAIDSGGVDMGITLHRIDPNRVKPRRFNDGMTRADRKPPARVPSKLPPPGSRRLELRLNRRLSEGRAGSIYATSEISPSPTSDETHAGLLLPYIPPLVAKVAFENRSLPIRREAWFYEEMECMQGVAIPRCYGLFEAEFDKSWIVKPWKDLDVGEQSHGNDNDDTEDQEEDEAEEKEEDYTRRRSTRIVVVLLLEQLGEKMPLRVYPTPQDVGMDIHDIYSALSEMGIYHPDISYYHMLKAPESPPGLPSLPCPFHNRTYGWRIISFSNAQKTNGTPDRHNGANRQMLQRLLSNLQFGDIIEAWE